MNDYKEPVTQRPTIRLALLRRTFSTFWAGSLFVAGYIATLVFFGFVDVYNQHFFQSSYAAVYCAFRVLLTGYLFWIIYASGRWATMALGGRRFVDALPVHERLAYGFFVGATILTAVMLVLGYLSLYWRTVAAALTIPIVVASWPSFSETVRQTVATIKESARSGPRYERTIRAGMVAAAVGAAALLLLVKGLYPQGGHDYFLHYFQYYSAVIDNHGLWPNHFWYHYYLSKGMGLMFLAMLLSDPLAPSLVSFCFAVAAALALFSLVRRFCPQTLWPWLAVILYFALNVHTLGVGPYSLHGGWGHFQKPHEINSPFLIAILWMSVNMVREEGEARWAWCVGAAACSFIIAFIMLVTPGIIGPFAVFAGLGFLVLRNKAAWAFGGLAVASGIGMVSVLLLNYMTTGAPADVAPSLWWPIVDLRQMAEQGTLYDYAWATTVRRNSNVNWGLLGGPLDPVLFLVNFSRFDVLETLIVWSIAVVGIFAFCWLFLRRRTFWAVASVSTANASALGVILAFVASIGLFSVGAGMSETVSYVRLTSFMLPLVIAIACIAWQAMIAAIKWPAPLQAALAVFMPPMLAYACLTDAFERQKLTLAKVVTNAVRFAGGQYSIYDANRDQAGWPGLPYSSAIYPPMLEAWKSIGPGKRIWTFSVHSYCMLPGCHPEGLYSSTMTKHRTEVLFGSPEEARATLQREGLNYFFIRTAEIREITHCSPLFVADTLADYFDFQWTDGTDALLTWKGQGIAPVSKQWLEKYREATKPHKFLEDCAGQQYFRNAGRALSEAVAQGKRWGREVPMP